MVLSLVVCSHRLHSRVPRTSDMLLVLLASAGDVDYKKQALRFSVTARWQE